MHGLDWFAILHGVDMTQETSLWRKRQTDALIEEDMDIPMQQHRAVIAQTRNQTLEEVAQEFEKFTWAFGVDTAHSFATFVRGMKDEMS